jgi:outer membrane lipoprotein-sorting protein
MKKIVIALLFSAISFAQTNDANKIIEKVKQNFLEVKDYQVDVEITVNVDFLKVPISKAKIYFKQPDKIKINSEGFAMLPKEGVNFSPLSLLKGNYTTILEKVEKLENSDVFVIKVIPLGETPNIILSTLWIDKKDLIIRKVESTTKMNGTFTIDLDYNKKVTTFYLPSKLVFSFDVSRSNIPMNIEKERDNEPKNKKKSRLTKGTVIVNYSNYKVNIGLNDDLFKEEKKKETKK